MKTNFLFKKKFRVSSAYHLAEWNHLSIPEQESLVGYSDDEQVYGIFKPALSTSPLTKVAYREVAFLWLHLQQSNQLPRYLIASDKKDLHNTIAQLVLDNILEIECNGNFVSGTAAVSSIFGDRIAKHSEVPDYLSDLSMEGIKYAFLLNKLDTREIANRLYTFNTLPFDASSKSHFNALQTIKEFLIPQSSTELDYLLHKHWFFAEEAESKGWLYWYRREESFQFPNLQNSFTYKLYISPGLHDLQNVFKSSIPVLSSSQAFGFKTGNSLTQLLRSDKMIAYFENMDALTETANLLEKELAAYATQGVPFTKQLDKRGMLSWGVDPPQQDDAISNSGESWRFKVTNELAIAIIQAREEGLNLERAIPFIRAKLSLAGINTNDWTPLAHFFQSSS